MKSLQRTWEIRRRVDDFLWRKQGLHSRRLRTILKNLSAEHEAAIFGGMIRDLTVLGAGGFSSDVDLVIDASASTVRTLASRLNATQNVFGGYRAQIASWHIDFWALSETWVHQKNIIEVNDLRDLPSSTFFVNDAVVYLLNERKLYAHENYIKFAIEKILEINVEQTPSVLGNLVRAVRRLYVHQMIPGDRLMDFIDRHLDDSAFRYVVETEQRLYGRSFARSTGSADNFKRLMKLHHSRREPISSDEEQESLAL
jgi:hypothetical protein